MQNFQALGAPPPDPVPPTAGGFAPTPPIASGGWELRPQTSKTAPPQLRIPGYAPATHCNVYNYMGLGSFCFEQFFLDRPVANLMILTVDVCLIVFWMKSFICITPCVTLIPFCYIALSYLFAKV